MSNGWKFSSIPKRDQPTRRWDMVKNAILHPRSRKAGSNSTHVAQQSSNTTPPDTSARATPKIKITRQIVGPNLDPVIVEYEKGRHCLGYLCDVNKEGTQFLVDIKCSDESLRWFPVGKVYEHFQANLGDLCLCCSVLVAVRNCPNTPYVFQPARLLFIDRSEENREDTPPEHQHAMYRSSCRTYLVYVETLMPDSDGNLIRTFVHPHQIRAGRSENGIFYLDVLRLMNTTRYVRRTVHLDADQDAENIDLKHLLDTFLGSVRDHNRGKWLMRIRVDEEAVHLTYREPYDSCQLEDAEILRIIRRALHPLKRELVCRQGSGPVAQDRSVVYLPFNLQQLILLELEDIHSILSAKRVCKVWHVLLKQVGRKHVAIDIDKIKNSHSKWKQLSLPGLYHLVAILSNTVNKKTIALTLIGRFSAELELAVYQFLIAKGLFIHMIHFKNACCHPLKQDATRRNLTLSNINNLQRTCRTLRLTNVTVQSVLGPVAGLWCMPARERYKTDLDVHVPLAFLDCTKSKSDIVRQFLCLLNRHCPALTIAEWEKVKHLYGTILSAGLDNPYRQRLLLMLELLQNMQIISFGGYLSPQGSLSRLAAHSVRFSFYKASACHSQKHPLHEQHCITYAKCATLAGVDETRRGFSLNLAMGGI